MNGKRPLALLVALTLLLSLVPLLPAAVSATDSQTVAVKVDRDDLLDLVLTLGKTDTDVSNLESDLTQALVAKGVPLDKIAIQAVESSEVSAGNTSIGWEIYDHTNFNDGTVIPFYRPYYAETNGNYTLGNHIGVSTGASTTIDFYGYGAPAYKDFMYMPNDQFGTKTFDFTIQEGSFYDALDGAGFLFNTAMSSGADLASRTMSGYLVFFQYQYSAPPPTATLYKFTNIDVNAFHNQLSIAIQSGYPGFTKLATFAAGSESTRVVKIEAASDTLKMWYNGNPVTFSIMSNGTTASTVALDTDFGSYGFGPLVGYLSHGCNRLTHFTFNNVTMSMESAKRFSDVIREPEWRDGSKRFIINALDGAVADFSDPVALGEILARLGNEGIAYVGWGKNAADGMGFIAKNDGNGTYVDKTQAATDTYAEQIEALADYVYLKYLDSVVNDTSLLVYGKPSSMTISPESEKNDTIDADWPSGKWKIVHDETHFDNPTGTALYDNQYLNNLDISFVETGKYDIYYKDSLIKTVYVHRAPVAGFGITLDGDRNVTITDNAYDPDHQSAPDKGIAATAWTYRETTSDTWIDGQPTTFEAGRHYIVKQTVTDVEGETGTPYYRYVSTAANASAKPIAEFAVTPARLLTYQSELVGYMDSSYDPQGAAITERIWTVSLGSAVIYTGPVPKTDFTGSEAGIYKIVLSVKNASNVWSEEVARFLTVVRDSAAPDVVSDTNADTYDMTKVVKITISDEAGGSGFSARYAVVNSTAGDPANWGSIGTNAVFNVALANTGTWYIHVKAQDYAGNETISTFGPYILTDNQPPTDPIILATPSYTDGTWSGTPITLTASGSADDFTDADDLDYFHSIDGIDFAAGNQLVLSTDGIFTITFKATDAAGHDSGLVQRTVRIDTTVPSEPDFTAESGSADYTPGSWAIAPVTFTLSSATDAASGVAGYEYKIDDGAWQSGTTGTIADSGVCTVTFRSVDNAGNTSAEGIRTIKIDTAAPTDPAMTFTTANGDTLSRILNFLTLRQFYHEAVDVTITTSDDVSGIAGLYWKIGAAGPIQTTTEDHVTFTLPLGFTGTVTAYAVDAAGLASSSVVSDGTALEAVKPVITTQNDLLQIKVKAVVDVTVDDTVGLALIRTRVGLEAYQTIDLVTAGTDPVVTSAFTMEIPFTGTTSEAYVVQIEATDLAGNIETRSLSILPPSVIARILLLPDPATAPNDDVLDSETDIRDTKRLYDMLTAEEKNGLPAGIETRFDQLLARMTQLLQIISRDEDTGVEADAIGTAVRIEELNDQDASLIRIELMVEKNTEQSVPNFVITADAALSQQDREILQSFDIFLLKTVTSQTGQSQSGKVGNEDITGLITIRLPVPPEFENRQNLQVVYIANDGTVTPLPTTLVTIDGQKYLEFTTSHFSTYAIVADIPVALPDTGETGSTAGLLILSAAPCAWILVILKKRRSRRSGQAI